MGRKLSPIQLELYHRIDEILFYIWDPIGVAEIPQARDEYHKYLPEIFKMIIDSARPDAIANYLIQIETESMGLDNTKISRENAIKIAELLIEHYEWIKQTKKN